MASWLAIVAAGVVALAPGWASASLVPAGTYPAGTNLDGQSSSGPDLPRPEFVPPPSLPASVDGFEPPAGTSTVRQRTKQVSLPASATALVPRVSVRRQPRSRSPVRAVMFSHRRDYHPTVFFVVGRRQTTTGEWLRVQIPGRPNGRTGWVRASLLRLDRANPFRIVIRRQKRSLILYRNNKVVLRTRVAVGTRNAPTPLGSFYVAAAFRPTDRFYGPWALETSAGAAISDWPGGGIVGIHGTSEPWSIGKFASHGCIRLPNKMIRKLKHRAKPGTPIRIRR